MLKVEVRVYDDVKKVTRDQYGKSVESSEREKVVDFTTVAIDAERLVLTTATMMCVALDVDFVHDGENLWPAFASHLHPDSPDVEQQQLF